MNLEYTKNISGHSLKPYIDLSVLRFDKYIHNLNMVDTLYQKEMDMLPSKYNKLDKLLKSQKLNIKSFEDKGQGKFKFLDIRVKEADRLTTFNNLRNLIKKDLKIDTMGGTGGRANKDFDFRPDSINSPYYKFRILIKPEKGSKPQDNDHETLSAYCTAQAMAGSSDFSLNALSKLRNVDGVNLSTAYKKCGIDWLESSIIHGEFLKKYYGTLNQGYFFLQRGGSGKAAWIKRLYNRFKKLKKELGINLNDDKWDPADMWIVHNDCLDDNFENYTDLKGLNAYLVQKYNQKKVIGVSLKKCTKGKTVKARVENVKRSQRGVKNVEVKRGPILVKYSTINFELMKGNGTSEKFSMAVRPFTNEEASGELKGSGSLAGKVGITEINRLLKLIVKKEIERKPVLMPLFLNKQKEFFKLFYERYEKEKGKVGINNDEDLQKEVNKLGGDVMGYYMGKFQAVSVCHMFDTVMKNDEQRNQVMLGMYAYASSTTDNSGPFLKVSN